MVQGRPKPTAIAKPTPRLLVIGRAARKQNAIIHVLATLYCRIFALSSEPQGSREFFRQLFPLWHPYLIIRASLSARN